MTGDLNLLPWRQQRRQYTQRQWHRANAWAFILALIITLLSQLFLQFYCYRQTQEKKELDCALVSISKKMNRVNTLLQEQNNYYYFFNTLKQRERTHHQLILLFDSLFVFVSENLNIRLIECFEKEIILSGEVKTQEIWQAFIAQIKKNNSFLASKTEQSKTMPNETMFFIKLKKQSHTI